MTNQQKIDAIIELSKGLDYGDCVDVLCHIHRRVDELWGEDALYKAQQIQIRESQKLSET